MSAPRKLLLVGPALGLLALRGVQCTVVPPSPPASAGPVASLPAAPSDSTAVLVPGQVGAGGTDPVLAHVAGRVRQVYFAGGEYVHRGQLLLKLYTPDYVLAGHDGFLGPCLVSEGQWVGRATPVTTLSRRRHLVVSLMLPEGQWGHLGAGDSVRVWVATRPTRVVTGVIGPRPPAPANDFQREIALPLRSPFHLGEQVVVRLPVGAPGHGSPRLALPVLATEQSRR